MARFQEAQLVAAAKRGDVAALGQLLEDQQHRLFNVCYRMVGNSDDAAELTQDAMLRVVEHIGQYDGRAAFGTWITRIAMNLAVSHLRKQRLRWAASLDHRSGGNGEDQSSPLRDQLADSREPEPHQSVQRDEMIAHLQTALDRIDDDLRAVLVLRDIDQMDYRQIAGSLAIPVGTVKSRLFRARLALRHEMFKICPPPEKNADAQAMTDG